MGELQPVKFVLSPWSKEYDRFRAELAAHSDMENDEHRVVVEGLFRSLGFVDKDVSALMEALDEDEDAFCTLISPYWASISQQKRPALVQPEKKEPDLELAESTFFYWHAEDFASETQAYAATGQNIVFMNAPPSKEAFLALVQKYVLRNT